MYMCKWMAWINGVNDNNIIAPRMFGQIMDSTLPVADTAEEVIMVVFNWPHVSKAIKNLSEMSAIIAIRSGTTLEIVRENARTAASTRASQINWSQLERNRRSGSSDSFESAEYKKWVQRRGNSPYSGTNTVVTESCRSVDRKRFNKTSLWADLYVANLWLTCSLILAV